MGKHNTKTFIIVDTLLNDFNRNINIGNTNTAHRDLIYNIDCVCIPVRKPSNLMKRKADGHTYKHVRTYVLHDGV